MIRRFVALCAVAGALALPSLAWAVATTFPLTEVGTQKTVPTGEIKLGDGTSFKVSEGESPRPVDRSFITYEYFSPSHWTQRGQCATTSDPSRCPIEVNPVYPFQNDAPPFGAILFNPVAFGQSLNNLPLRRFQLTDRAPTFTNSQVDDRRTIGEKNNAENYPLGFDFFGADIVFGGPQFNWGPIQLNTGIGLIGGRLGVNKQVTSRVDNRESNQSLAASGFAGGPRLESVLSAPGWPLFGSGIPGFRATYQGLWGHVTGGTVSRADAGDLGSFGMVPNQQDSTEVDFSSNRLTGEFLVTTLKNHLTLGVGGGYQQVTSNMQITREGTVPGVGSVTRKIRALNRGDQAFGLVSADLFIGNWCSCFAPFGFRVEGQFGPGNAGVFAKATWMFGVNGPTIPQMFWKTFPPANP